MMVDVTKNLTGLQPNQQYIVQVRAKGEGNSSEWSNAYTFSTPSALLQTKNQSVCAVFDGGAIASSSSMWMDKDGLHAFSPSGASTVYISSTTGDAYFSGSIVSGAGSIGGWSITPGKLYADNGTASNYVAISSSNDWAFWAGSSDPTTAPFAVKKDGSVTATKLSASVANIGGWQLLTNEFYSGSIHFVSGPTNPRMYIGAGNFYTSDTPFYVDSYGRFSLSNQVNFTPSATYGDDFGALTVNGKIRGAIENVTAIQSNKLSASIVSASTGVNTASLTTSASTTFLTGENFIIAGFTGNASEINGTYTATMIDRSTIQITKSSGSWTYQSTTYSSLSDVTAVLRELTMGLHPAEASSSLSWYHDVGVGIRLDKYNWWLTNNQFRVGTADSYFKWNGTKFDVQGSGTYKFQLSLGNSDSNTYMAITSTGSADGYQDTYYDYYGSYEIGPNWKAVDTPFYVDSAGKFSLGSKFYWDGSALSLEGSINATAGTIGQFTINPEVLYAGTGSTTVGLGTRDYAIFAGGGKPNLLLLDPSFESASGIYPIRGSGNSNAYTWYIGNTGSSTLSAASISDYAPSASNTGTTALQIVKTSSSVAGLYSSLNYTLPAWPGGPQTFSVYLKSPSVTVSGTIGAYLGSSGSSLSTSILVASAAFNATSAWNQFSVILPISGPRGSAYTIFIDIEGAPISSSLVIDGAKLESGSTVFPLDVNDSANFYVTNTGDTAVNSLLNFESGRASISAAVTTITLTSGRFSKTPYVVATARANSSTTVTRSVFVGNESPYSFTVFATNGTSLQASDIAWIASAV